MFKPTRCFDCNAPVDELYEGEHTDPCGYWDDRIKPANCRPSGYWWGGAK